ncbi:MAG: SPASM domain-containing protein [Patescibacteria group bacterium]
MKSENLLKDGYPYTGIIKWDKGVIENSIKQVKHNNSLPDFGLKRIEIHPTSICQYKCPFCYGINFKLKKKTDLPLEIIENNIFKNIKNSKLIKDDPIVILAGLYSEPLAHSDKLELIRLLGKYKFRFGIYTNGGFLNNDTIKAICESAKQNKSDRSSYISFNVVAAITHGDYDSLEKKIKNLIETRNAMNAPVQVNIPILVNGDLSGHDLKNLQNKLLKIGVDKIRYSIPQIPVEGNKVNKVNVGTIKLINALQRKNKENVFVRSISGKQFDRCYVLANTVSVDCNGDVYPCSQTCSENFQGLSYGSVKNKKLTDIWGSKEHKKLFSDFSKIPTYCRCNLSDQQFNTVCTFFN